ncbi:amino acid permease [bacterium]|nr:amino acid permease [bacterium]
MQSSMKRDLGLFGVFAIATGCMISSGLFVLPGIAFEASGPAVILAYALASILVIPSLLSKAELATAMPKAGGSYFFIERSMGPLAGMLAGFAGWLSLTLKSAFALLGIGAFAALIYPDITSLQVKLIAITCCVFFTVLNLISIESVGRTQIVLVVILLALLLLYIGEGVGKVDVQRFADFMPKGFGSILATAGLVFVSFGGLTKIASIAEEVRNPGRNIPLGMFIAFFVVSGLYIVVVFITVGLVPAESLGGSLTPISLGAGLSMGRAGIVALAVAAILAFITTANSGIASASRSPMAMSRDGLLPKFLQKMSPGRGIPYVSVILTSGFMVMVIAFLSIEDLIKTASTMKLILFALVNVSVIVMRESKIQSYRPVFRSPFYPWIQGAAIAIYGFLIFEMGALPMIISGIFGLLALGWYAIYCRATTKRQSALVHLVRRITSKELVNGSLESELREIVYERDEIVEDRFDKLIQNSEIFDIKEAISSHKMLSMVAGALAPRFGLPEADLLKMFLEREHESSTVVGQGIAIPHVVIEGDHLFDIVLVRCKPGITFSMGPSNVHTAFVMVGSRDERNYHLRALMAIAQITQEPGFHKRWLEAKSASQLRNFILISGRKRDEKGE